MNKKSRQKFKYLEKEKSFYDEIEQIFRFWRAIIELNFFFEGERPITNKQISKIYCDKNQQTYFKKSYCKSTSTYYQYQIAFKDLPKLISCYWIALSKRLDWKY